MDKTILTQDDMAKVFAEWDRRYREDPEAFLHEVRHLLGETPESYGEAAAAYFIMLVGEMGLET